MHKLVGDGRRTLKLLVVSFMASCMQMKQGEFIQSLMRRKHGLCHVWNVSGTRARSTRYRCNLASKPLHHTQASMWESCTPPCLSRRWVAVIQSLGPHMQNTVVSETGAPMSSSSCCALSDRTLPLTKPSRASADSSPARNLRFNGEETGAATDDEGVE